jgi:hypothetical protein
LYSGDVSPSGPTSLRFDASSLSTGIYILRLLQEGRATSARVIVGK